MVLSRTFPSQRFPRWNESQGRLNRISDRRNWRRGKPKGTRDKKKISRQKWEEMQGIRKLQVLIMPLIETVIEWRLACDSWWGADRKSISHRPTDDGSSLIKTVILHRSLSSSFVFFYGLDPSIVKARPDCIGLFGVGLLFYCLFFLRLVSDKHQLQLPNFTRVLLA